MDVFYAYTYGTAAWLTIQALPLAVMPKLIISILAQEAHFATDLEIYFARFLGYTLLVLALIVLFFTGTIPISSTISEPISLEDTDSKAPYAVPIVRVTTLFHMIGLIYCYTRYVKADLAGYLLGAVGYGAATVLGGWCIMFGTSGGKISKRTGKDKRMTGFPFANVNEYDKHKDKKMG